VNGTPDSSTGWFLKARKAHAEGALRLFCLPYAGDGSAVCRAWQDHLAPDVEVLAVQLLGRAARLRERPCGNLRGVTTVAACA
jgi:medium-chain acyl-[acyl-carrier-protein] hydrolase